MSNASQLEQCNSRVLVMAERELLLQSALADAAAMAGHVLYLDTQKTEI